MTNEQNVRQFPWTPGELLRRAEVLDRYRISPPTLGRWLRSRGFPSPVKIVRTPLWRRADLERWEQSRIASG